tara:strand:- start:699 stop:929 length:231 start_codon:yes stop_codon:yes gene_type:complete
MANKDLSAALKKILEKEIKKFGSFIPKDVISDIETRISPQIEKIIEQSGYVKKSKYENLERIISDLEERLDKLEKD